MTAFESKVLIKKPLQEVYSFLADLNNHEQLMPDNVSNWSSTKDTAQFSIKNMGNLTLRVTSRVLDKNILIEPASDAPFKTAINWHLSQHDENTTQATVTISAELNMMMKMMASGMLQKLADHQGQSLEKVMGR